MHFGKTLMATTAATLPLPAANATTAEIFSRSLGRQQAEASFTGQQSAPSLPVMRSYESSNNQTSAENSLFKQSEHFAKLVRYSRHGDDVRNKGALKILTDRAVQAEALQLLKFHAEGSHANYAPVTQATRDYHAMFNAENVIETIAGVTGFNGGSLMDLLTFAARLNGVLQDKEAFSKDVQTMGKLYIKEVARQKENPITEKQRQELLDEIAQIEAEHENSGMDDFKAMAMNEAQSVVTAWLASQIRQRVINRFPI